MPARSLSLLFGLQYLELLLEPSRNVDGIPRRLLDGVKPSSVDSDASKNHGEPVIRILLRSQGGLNLSSKKRG